MRKSLITSIIAGTLSMSAAHAAEKNMEMAYEAPPLSQKKAIAKVIEALPAECAFTTAAALDLRQNKQTIAIQFGQSLIGDNVTSWLDSAVSQNLPNQQSSSSATNVKIVPKLRRLYSYPESMNILGVTALELDYMVGEKVALTKHYRGFYAKTNWAGGDGEFISALNLAINNSMPKNCQRSGQCMLRH